MLEAINTRVDAALKYNQRAENIVLGCAFAIFVLGVVGIALQLAGNKYGATLSAVATGFLYWPINEILRMRRDNLILQTLPAMIASLPPAEAAKKLEGLLREMWFPKRRRQK